MSTALATNEKESDVDNIEDPPSNTIASSLKNAYETIVGDCIGQEQEQGQGQGQPSPSSDSDNIHLAPPAKHAAVHPNAPPPPTSNSCSPFFSLTAASDLHITTKQPRLFTDEDTASEAEDQNANDSEESDPFEDLVEQSANQYHQKHHKQEEDDQSEATEKASNLSSSSATTTTTITTTTTPLNIPTPLMEEEEEETSESTAYIAMDEDTFLLFCDDEKDQNEQETQKPGIAILRPITPPLSPLNTSSTSTTTTSNGQADSSGAAWSSGTDSSGLDDSQDTGSLSLPTSATTTPTSTNTNTNTTNAAMIPPNNTTHDEDDESPFDEEEWLQDLANDVDSDEQDPAQTQQQQQQHQRKNPFENIDPDIEESYEVEHVEEEPFEDEPMQDHSNAIPQDNPAVGKESEEDSLGYDIENPKQESDKILQQSPSYDIESMTKSTKSVQEEFEDEPKWDDSYYGSDDDASKWLDDDQHFANTTPSPSENPHIDDEDDFEAHMIQDDEEIIGILPFETNSSHSSSSDDDDGPPIKNVSVKESVDTKRDNGSLSDDGSNRTQAGYGVCFVTYCVLITVVVGLSMIIFFLFDGENKTSKEGLQQSLMYLSSDPTVFDDPQSPQSKALDWLAGPSNENIDLNDKIRRENRYALAVLYFATGGENNLWEFDLGFLSSEHECSWNGFNEVAVQLGVLCEGNKNVVNLRIGTFQ